MIGKSLVLFCVALGCAAATYVQVPQYNYGLRSPVVAAQYVSSPIVASQVVSSPLVNSQVVSSPLVGSQVVSTPVVQYSGNNLYGSNLLEANVVSSGAAIATDGPETAPLPVLQAPSVTLPTVEAPMVALPSQPIPAPRVISQRCVCTKTVVKPQIIQRQVTVPKVQRYLKRTVTPIVENVSYKSRPISSQSQAYGSSVGVASNSVAYSSGNCYSRTC